MLVNDTISGIALGSNLDTLTFGTHLTTGGSSYNGSAAVTITSDATSSNTDSTIVARDASGNFSATTITAALTGTASGNIANSLMTTLGDLIYEYSTPAPARLPGPTAAASTTYVLTDTTNGSKVAQIPAWSNAPALAGTNFTVIPNGALSNDTISGIALGGNLDSVTFNNGGGGASSGSTYNGSATLTVSYNTLGAQAALGYTPANCTAGTSANDCLQLNGSALIPYATIPFGTATNQVAEGGVITGGSAGGATAVPEITYNAAGQITGISTTAPTVTAVNGVSFGTPGAAGQVLDSTSSSAASYTATPTLGANGGTGGSITLEGSSSGSATINTSASGVLALPSGTTATSMSLTTPSLGAATATTINRVTVSAPATGSTLTIADGTTLSNTYTMNVAKQAGVAGGIPWFDTTTSESSSALLTHYGLIYGGGSAGAPVSMAACGANFPVVGSATVPGCSTIGWLSSATQWGIPYMSTDTQMSSTAALTGILYSSGSGAPTAATAAQLGTLANLPKYSIPYSAGTTSALSDVASPTVNDTYAMGWTVTGSAAVAPAAINLTTLLSTYAPLASPTFSGTVTNGNGTGLPLIESYGADASADGGQFTVSNGTTFGYFGNTNAVVGGAAADDVILAADNSLLRIGSLGSYGIDFISGGWGTTVATLDTSGNFTANGTITGLSVKASGSGAVIGYATGKSAGCSVTQVTGRTNGVTCDGGTGAITLYTATGSTTPQAFVVTDTSVAATDTVVCNEKSGTNFYNCIVTAVGSGTFNLAEWTTGGTVSEAPVFNFTVIKGSAN
jgi:hypothetical protein